MFSSRTIKCQLIYLIEQIKSAIIALKRVPPLINKMQLFNLTYSYISAPKFSALIALIRSDDLIVARVMTKLRRGSMLAFFLGGEI